MVEIGKRSTRRTPPFLANLKKSLIDVLKENGIVAEVDTEPVPTTRMHRVYVLAPRFKAMRHSERQELVWRIAEKTLPTEDQFRISMILTLTPEEAGVKPRRARKAKSSPTLTKTSGAAKHA
ncbi:MAG: hypothetical protein NTW86_19125 [Candidatus Sumerlaeota bacterium]|nr:hypothetical protein [Candidatus Sumerlaeota bacterium]